MNKSLVLAAAFTSVATTGCMNLAQRVQDGMAGVVGANNIEAVIRKADQLQPQACVAGKAMMTVADPCNDIVVTKVDDQLHLKVTPKAAVARVDAKQCATVWSGLYTDATGFSLKSFTGKANDGSNFGALELAVRDGFVTGANVNYNSDADLAKRLSTTKYASLVNAGKVLGAQNCATAYAAPVQPVDTKVGKRTKQLHKPKYQ